MTLETVKENCFNYNEIVDILSQSHYTYDGDEGIIYDDYPFDGYEFLTGASKICIPAGDYVFKTSFSGYAYDYNYETSDFYDEPLFEDWKVDYCEAEYKIYELAKAAGLGRFFAATYKINSRVYVQERCPQIFEDYCGSPYVLSKRDNTDTDTFLEILDDLGLSFLRQELHFRTMRYLVMEYSINDLLALQDFIITYDINDLHDGNCGFFGDKIKFFDFCGYNSDTFEKLK